MPNSIENDQVVQKGPAQSKMTDSVKNRQIRKSVKLYFDRTYIDVPIAHVPSESEIISKENYGTYTKEFPF